MLRLRSATRADALLLRGWRNDAATREASRNTAEVGEEEHDAWLEFVLADANRLLFVAEQEGLPVGQVRLDRDRDRWEISVALAPEARGRGLGAALIDAGIEQLADLGGGVVEAWVRPGNAASMAAFRRAGFVEAAEPAGADFILLTRSV